MRIDRLDHVNIHTEKLAETISFYEQVMGLTEHRAPGLDPERTAWMYDDQGRALIHLGMDGTILEDGEEPPKRQGGGAVHHIAFNCQDYDAMVARLEGLRIPYRTNTVDEVDLKQIFVHDPNGVMLELNFFQTEIPR